VDIFHERYTHRFVPSQCDQLHILLLTFQIAYAPDMVLLVEKHEQQDFHGVENGDVPSLNVDQDHQDQDAQRAEDGDVPSLLNPDQDNQDRKTQCAGDRDVQSPPNLDRARQYRDDLCAEEAFIQMWWRGLGQEKKFKKPNGNFQNSVNISDL
jgi:hypothetical protein